MTSSWRQRVERWTPAKAALATSILAAAALVLLILSFFAPQPGAVIAQLLVIAVCAYEGYVLTVWVKR